MEYQQSVTFMEAIKRGYRNYFITKGRASRSEFWRWMLFAVMTGCALFMIMEVVSAGFLPEGYGEDSSWNSTEWEYGDDIYFKFLLGWFLVTFLAVGLPTYSYTIRRLHDVGISSALVWIQTLIFVPVLALIIWANIDDSYGMLNMSLFWPFLFLYVLPLTGLAIYNGGPVNDGESKTEADSQSGRKGGSKLWYILVPILGALLKFAVKSGTKSSHYSSGGDSMLIFSIIAIIVVIVLAVIVTLNLVKPGEDGENKYGRMANTETVVYIGKAQFMQPQFAGYSRQQVVPPSYAPQPQQTPPQSYVPHPQQAMGIKPFPAYAHENKLRTKHWILIGSGIGLAVALLVAMIYLFTKRSDEPSATTEYEREEIEAMAPNEDMYGSEEVIDRSVEEDIYGSEDDPVIDVPVVSQEVERPAREEPQPRRSEPDRYPETRPDKIERSQPEVAEEIPATAPSSGAGSSQDHDLNPGVSQKVRKY